MVSVTGLGLDAPEISKEATLIKEGSSFEESRALSRALTSLISEDLSRIDVPTLELLAHLV